MSQEKILNSRRRLLGLPEAVDARTLATAAAAVSATVSWITASARSTDRESEIIYMSATKLAEQIREKKVSALEATDAYIARQLAVNDRLNAVVMNCYERARAEAKALDVRAARGDWAGPLHGVPMTLKDSLDTEGVITTGATSGASSTCRRRMPPSSRASARPARYCSARRTRRSSRSAGLAASMPRATCCTAPRTIPMT